MKTPRTARRWSYQAGNFMNGLDCFGFPVGQMQILLDFPPLVAVLLGFLGLTIRFPERMIGVTNGFGYGFDHGFGHNSSWICCSMRTTCLRELPCSALDGVLLRRA